jgi:flagellar biosynthesis protein FlhG
LAGIIRRDDRVADAIRRQTPFLTRYPETETANDIAKLAAKLG